MRVRVRRLSPATMVALVALYLAINGGASAQRSVVSVASKPVIGVTLSSVVSPMHDLGPLETANSTQECPSGEDVIGGGYVGSTSAVSAPSFHLSSDGKGWKVVLHNAQFVDHAEVQAEVLCLKLHYQK